MNDSLGRFLLVALNTPFGWQTMILFDADGDGKDDMLIWIVGNPALTAANFRF